jgi:predicted glycogen debranching enzyme
VWVYRIDGFTIEKRILMPHGQNTVHITYRVVEGAGTLRFTLRPSVQFRGYEAPVDEALASAYTISATGERYELSAGDPWPILRMMLVGERAALTLDEKGISSVPYKMEEARGYQWTGSLWSPGYFRADAQAGQQVSLIASAEPWDTVVALSPDEAAAAERERRRKLIAIAEPPAEDAFAAELVLASDQFIIKPAGRVEEAARAKAGGDEVRTVIAGYHWFTDWGRDTMISLEGLSCTTGRHVEASYILRTFGQYVRDGLIPNMFPDGSNEGLYHTADATLWFFHAIDRYLAATGDRATLVALMPKLTEIVQCHLEGTRYGIHVDPKDGLLVQGADGYQLTWMDAKCDGWVVTPRRGKAVEINALWYNALRLFEGWTREAAGEEAAHPFLVHAEQCRLAFNERFWYEEGRYLYDVVESADLAGKNDIACRPNQLLAISLTHPVLDAARWAAVVDVARVKLLTPVGLRSLSPDDPDFKPTYHGDLRTRDAAYHQGTVWAWLIGPFIDAWLKVHPEDRAGARRFLDGFTPHLDEACVGSISEVFDAVEPYAPRGCVAQAWSVAEVLRCWALTAEPEAGARDQ